MYLDGCRGCNPGSVSSSHESPIDSRIFYFQHIQKIPYIVSDGPVCQNENEFVIVWNER
jgi:hypothetical protein